VNINILKRSKPIRKIKIYYKYNISMYNRGVGKVTKT